MKMLGAYTAYICTCKMYVWKYTCTYIICTCMYTLGTAKFGMKLNPCHSKCTCMLYIHEIFRPKDSQSNKHNATVHAWGSSFFLWKMTVLIGWVALCCVVLLWDLIFHVHVYMYVHEVWGWYLWWFNYPGLLLDVYTKFEFTWSS